jgi:hypothetical protein
MIIRPIRRTLNVCTLLVGFVLATSLLPDAALAQRGASPLVPPWADFRGRSFAEWNFLCEEWTVATGLGGQVLPDTIDGMRLLPGRFSPGQYEFHVQVKPGTGFVFPSFFLFGEEYDDGTADDPVALADLIDLIYETTSIETRVDGKVVLQGLASELEDFQYGPDYFEEPIPYEQPQPRGPNLNAVSALWGLGIGSVYHPLPQGNHTIVSIVDSAFFGRFEYTYHIHVKPGQE